MNKTVYAGDKKEFSNSKYTWNKGLHFQFLITNVAKSGNIPCVHEVLSLFIKLFSSDLLLTQIA